MNKPRLFIGSSKEGLSVAYAIQSNLSAIAEVTVWDQGVFNLSESTLESLISVLDNTDFGIFVFTPDDHIKIRGKKDLAVRDNVLFELGLFIGKLTRRRSFIVIPDNMEFHLPTDLIGVSPAKYESSRTDENLIAGTGGASNKIREIILKLGPVNPIDNQSTTNPIIKIEKQNKNEEWFDLIFIKKDYLKAIVVLKKKARYEKKEDEKINYKSIICYAEFKINAVKGKLEYEKLIEEYSDNYIPYLAYANLLFNNNIFKDSIKIIDNGLNKCKQVEELILLKSDCLWEINEKAAALELLVNSISKNKDSSFYIKLAYFYSLSDKKMAFDTLHKAFFEHPNNHEILFKFGRISFDLGQHEISALIFKRLSTLEPENSTYWTHLGSSYYMLNFYSTALSCYEKGAELSNYSEGWIIENIGNIFNSKTFYKKAEEFLLKAQKLNPKSNYAHSRLADVYKSQEDEDKRIEEIMSLAKTKLNSETISL